MNATSNKNNIPAWAIAAMILLLAFNVFQYFNYSKLKSSFQKQETELFQMEKFNATLESDFESAMSSLEELRSDNQLANELIESQKLELQNQRSKINKLVWTKRELGKAQDELNKLNSSVAKYVAEVNQLKAENQKLVASNSRLSSEKKVLTADLSAEKQKAESLAKEKEELAIAKTKLDKNNQILATQVDMAEAIKINYIKVEGFKRNDDGKVKSQQKVKKLTFIRTCFTTETNLVTKAGPKVFHVRLINPIGETVAVESLGSGILTDKLTGKPVRYTAKGTMDYKNGDQKACIDWEPNFKLMKGEYKVEMYNNDYLVGKGDFKLK